MTKKDENIVRAWTRLVRVGHCVMSAVEADLKARGFPPLAWYDVLLELDRAPDGALRPFVLEQKLLLAQYNFSRLAERLLRAGYIEKLPCPDDGRGQLLRITGAGRSLKRKMWPPYKAAIDRHIGGRLSSQQARDLARLLGELLPPSRDSQSDELPTGKSG